MKFPTQWYTKLCNLVNPFEEKLRYKVKFSIYPYITLWLLRKKKIFFPKLFQTGQIDFPTKIFWTKKMEFEKFSFFLFNPLTTNVKYTWHDTVVTSDSCNSGHSENYENFLTFLSKSLKFPTKWYTKLCNLVDPFLRNCITKLNFQYLKKNWTKKT